MCSCHLALRVPCLCFGRRLYSLHLLVSKTHILLWLPGLVVDVYLDKGEFAQASAALGVPDGDLAVVLDPASAAQDVVYAGGDLVPLIVVPEPGGWTSCRLAFMLIPTQAELLRIASYCGGPRSDAGLCQQ